MSEKLRGRRESGAQEIIRAEDIVKALRGGVSEAYEIEMRGTCVPVRILSGDEMTRVRIEARKQAIIAGGGMADETDMNYRIQKMTLTLASTVPVGTAPMLSEKVLSLLSPDEVAYLFDQWIGVNRLVNPKLDEMSDEEFWAVVNALKKKALQWSELSLRQYVEIAKRLQMGELAKAWEASPTDN